MKENIMKRKLFSLLGVVLMAAALLASCSENDSLGWNNALGDKVYGIWYADYQAQGTVGSDIPYSRVLQAVQFNTDGTGTWWKAVFSADDASKPLYLYGGRYPLSGMFDYVTFANGSISAKRRGEEQVDGSPMSLSFHFQDGVITTEDGGVTQTLKPAPKDFDNLLLAIENSMHGAAADNYNINDGDITAQNWRQQEAIYIYDNKGVDVKDAKGRTGYTLVNLPWYNGTKLTNLPGDFCKDMTPENGWEWVVNYCGSRSIVNNNFFAVYNKYTGILRFFYYQPEGFSTGNDHVWQVAMTDNLATRTIIPYGVPNDRKLVNKAAINQTGQGTFMDYIAPWVDYKSTDGLIVPNAGWWAFDVDLSLTRPEALSEDDNIKLQMRSWSTQHNSLFSTMAANIDGSMRGSFEAQTTGTISMVSAATGITGMLGQLGGPAGDVVSAYMGGDTKGALSKAATLASGASNLYSGKPIQGAPVEGNVNLHTVGTYEGIINLLMNGTINTDGVISGSQPTVGIASPTLYFKDFDTKNTHLGQGVWNLKKTPVVYRTNHLEWKWAFDTGIHTQYSYDEPGALNVAYCQFYFFDPSSVEVELNPNVFPEDQIEWMQVDAVSGVRKGMMFNGTDVYAQALGIERTKMDVRYHIRNTGNRSYEPVSNFLEFFQDDKLRDIMHYPYAYGYSDDYAEQHGCLYNKDSHTDVYITWLMGWGANNYAIEPVYFVTKTRKDRGIKGKEFKTPAYEINVTLTVKLKGVEAPFVYNRTYLPEIKNLIFDDYGGKVEEIANTKNLSPKTAGHTELYDMLVTRLKKIKENGVGDGDYDSENDK